MLRRFSVNFVIFSIFLDGFIVVFALAAANNIRPFLNVFPFAEELYKPSIPIVLYIVTFTRFGLFKSLATIQAIAKVITTPIIPAKPVANTSLLIAGTV